MDDCKGNLATQILCHIPLEVLPWPDSNYMPSLFEVAGKRTPRSTSQQRAKEPSILLCPPPLLPPSNLLIVPPKLAIPPLRHLTHPAPTVSLCSSHPLTNPFINSSTDSVALSFSLLLLLESLLCRCKSVATVGGAISTTLISCVLSSCANCVRKFMLQKCMQALVPLYTGLMMLVGVHPSTLLTFIITALSFLERKYGRKPMHKLHQSEDIDIDLSIRLPQVEIPSDAKRALDPGVLHQASVLGCSFTTRWAKGAMSFTEPVSRT